MGLSRPDWLALTPTQYSLFRESWNKRSEMADRAAWEIARWQVFRNLCPPQGKKIAITDLIRFHWEIPQNTLAAKDASTIIVERKNNKQRFEKLKELWK